MQRTAIITGASGGIGHALCRAFLQDGYRVIATDLDPRHDDQHAFVELDLFRFSIDPSYRIESLSGLRRALEEPRLDALVNNAAVQLLGGVDDLVYADWQETLNVNLLAPFLLTQGLLEELEAATGSVVNIASVHAAQTKPGFVAYSTSKAALTGLTRAMAVDLGPRLRVNSLSPAATATPMLRAGFEGRPEAMQALASMHPAGRIAEPEEIAKAAVFLASREASFLTGANLTVDGGISVRLHDPE